MYRPQTRQPPPIEAKSRDGIIRECGLKEADVEKHAGTLWVCVPSARTLTVLQGWLGSPPRILEGSRYTAGTVGCAELRPCNSKAS